jgi:hypothetical protein
MLGIIPVIYNHAIKKDSKDYHKRGDHTKKKEVSEDELSKIFC